MAVDLLSVIGAALSVIAAVVSLLGAVAARRAARRLRITEPVDGEVHQEYASISGNGLKRGWVAVVLHHTDRWYCQENFATPSRSSSWTVEKCHFDDATVGNERTVVALAFPEKEVACVREAFGGWGPTGNREWIADSRSLRDFLNGLGIKYELSDYRRIRRLPRV
jgi:hypothetical protein